MKNSTMVKDCEPEMSYLQKNYTNFNNQKNSIVKANSRKCHSKKMEE